MLQRRSWILGDDRALHNAGDCALHFGGIQMMDAKEACERLEEYIVGPFYPSNEGLAKLKKLIERQAAEIVALQADIADALETITAQYSENAALKAERDALKFAGHDMHIVVLALTALGNDEGRTPEVRRRAIALSQVLRAERAGSGDG